MTTATLEAVGQVGCMHLADGMLVRLSGALTGDLTPDLRNVLLVPLAASCRDVVVDAGDVTDIADPALAVLVAANQFAADSGRRFLLSAASPALDAALEECGLMDELPRLGAPRQRNVIGVPAPRSAAE